MAETATAQANVSKLPRVEVGQTQIKGKISSRIRVGKIYIHVITAPAVDEYSYPRAYEVSSHEPLGEVDEPIMVICEVTGRRAQKTATDKETGETRKFPGAYVGLRAIEERF